MGTNGHLLQGAVDIAACTDGPGALALTLDHCLPGERRLLFRVPAPFTLRGIETDARDHLVDRRRPGLVTVHLNGPRRIHLRLQWRRG
ncbi:MAG: hypothetical protein ABIF71_01620 [Planctomycetota bacterium]